MNKMEVESKNISMLSSKRCFRNREWKILFFIKNVDDVCTCKGREIKIKTRELHLISNEIFLEAFVLCMHLWLESFFKTFRSFCKELISLSGNFLKADKVY